MLLQRICTFNDDRSIGIRDGEDYYYNVESRGLQFVKMKRVEIVITDKGKQGEKKEFSMIGNFMNCDYKTNIVQVLDV